MRTYKQTVEFANFVCHFGNEVLLDYLNEIVLPAFLQGARVRMYGRSRYLLHNVRVLRMTPDANGYKAPAIAGMFVMDTELRRDQVYENGKIVPSAGMLKSAPSSLFVLLLDNHKLMYSKQVAGAPGLSAFRSTIELLLKHRRIIYIDDLYKMNQERREDDPTIPKLTKRSLMDSIGAPDLEIVPLADTRSIDAFVQQFKKLKEVSIKVIKPNAEINNDGLFETVESARERVNSTATSLVHRNPDGLDKVESIKQIAPAMEGNAIVRLRGIGSDDTKISSSNDQISVREPLDVPAGVVLGSRAMYKSFMRLIRAGVIKIGRASISRRNQHKLERLSDGG